MFIKLITPNAFALIYVTFMYYTVQLRVIVDIHFNVASVAPAADIVTAVVLVVVVAVNCAAECFRALRRCCQSSKKLNVH